MKFKLDENFGHSAQQFFLEQGYDCHSVHDEGLAGADDPTILAAAVAEDRILVTMDHDFGNVLAYPPAGTLGVVVVNVPGRASRQFLRAMLELLLNACRRQLPLGKLWIVEPGRIREHQSSDNPSAE